MEVGSAVATGLAMALGGDVAAACAGEAAGPAEDDELPLRTGCRRSETVERPVPEWKVWISMLPSPAANGESWVRCAAVKCPMTLPFGGRAARRTRSSVPLTGDLAGKVCWRVQVVVTSEEPQLWWVAGRGCDAWLLHYGTSDPPTHAANWLRHDLGADPAAFAEALDRWLAYFDRLGIDGIATGGVILRRRASGNWMRADRIPADRLRPAGAQIERVFSAGNVISAMRDERKLLAEQLSLAPLAVLEQRAVLHEGEWGSAGAVLRLEEGLGFEASLDAATAGMLAALDGRPTVGDLVADMARLEGTSREAVEQAALPILAELLAAGFLELRREHPSVP